MEAALEFATTPPMDQPMRLQFHQYVTMLDRWANHVKSWLQASSHARSISHVVKFEDITFRFEETVSGLGSAPGLAPRRIDLPARDQNIVQVNIELTPVPGSDNRDFITRLAMSKYPGLMTRLGYS